LTDFAPAEREGDDGREGGDAIAAFVSPKKITCTPRLVALILNHMVKCSPRLLNRTFAALADPTRRRILEHLAHGDRCVTDLARPYSMSLPAVSKHLRVLENAGLVSRRRRGRMHSLKLEAKPMQQAQAWIEEYRKFWEESFDRLDEYLKQLQTKEKK
jgi:DNA-binding transcriptional ArsR family regulator